MVIHRHEYVPILTSCEMFHDDTKMVAVESFAGIAVINVKFNTTKITVITSFYLH